MKSLSQFAPFSPTSRFEEVLRHLPRPNAIPGHSHRGGADVAALPAPMNAALPALMTRVQQVQQDVRFAWQETMSSKLARTSLAQRDMAPLPTMDAAIDAILEQLNQQPEEHAELIRLYEHVAAQLRCLQQDAPALLLHVHKNPVEELPVIRQILGHDHAHGGKLGALLGNPDPDEIGHAFIPIKHMLVLAFQGVKNLPEHYRQEARVMMADLVHYLAKEQVSHSLAERIFDLTLFSLLLPPSIMGTKVGFTEIRHGWQQLGLYAEKIAIEEKRHMALANVSALVADTPYIQARRLAAREKIAALKQEKRSAQLTLALGFGAAFAGLSLVALSLMKFIAEACNATGKSPATVDQIGKVAPAFQTAAAIGAGVLGVALQCKSGALQNKMFQGRQRLQATFAESLPPALLAGRDDMELALSRSEKQYVDDMSADSAKDVNFTRRFTRVNLLFCVSAVLNAAANLLELGLYASSMLGRDMLRPTVIDTVGKILMSKDLVYTGIGAGMGLGSLQLFWGHGPMMKLDGAQHRSDHEIATGFLLLNDLLRAEQGIALRMHLYKQVSLNR